MAKKQTAPALPTFPKTPDFWGDEETGKPERLSPYELEDPDILPVAKNTLAQLEAWRAAQENPDEAEARQCYAENVARHLVGVFPNARISAEAYAAAAEPFHGADGMMQDSKAAVPDRDYFKRAQEAVIDRMSKAGVI